MEDVKCGRPSELQSARLVAAVAELGVVRGPLHTSMSTTMKVILVSAWWILFMAILAFNIWGQMAHRTYDARMRYAAFRWFLMPGRLRDRDVWVAVPESRRVVWSLFGFACVCDCTHHYLVMTTRPNHTLQPTAASLLF